MSSEDQTETESDIVAPMQCWICRLDDAEESGDELELSNEWVEPCLCIGSTRFVHQECLRSWINFQNQSQSQKPTCPQCLFEYAFETPKLNRMLRLIEFIDNSLYNWAPITLFLTLSGCVYVVLVLYGGYVIWITFGPEDGPRLLERMNSKLMYLLMPMIPIGLFSFKMLKWENYLLDLWYYNYEKTPLFRLLGMPQPPKTLSKNAKPVHRPCESISRFLCSSIYLPSIAAFVGRHVFTDVSPIIKRTIYGGLAFVAVKGLLKVYLQQNQIVVRSNRKALSLSKDN